MPFSRVNFFKSFMKFVNFSRPSSHQPTIVALYHNDHRLGDAVLLQSQEKITQLFRRAGKKDVKRVVYVENFGIDSPRTRKMFGPPLAQEDMLNPHVHAVKEARALGWSPVSLDTGIHYAIQPKYRSFESEEDQVNRELLNRYVNTNLRERHWAQRIKGKISSNDFVVLHPAHVPGFLEETGFSPRQVVWIDRPKGNEYKRLDARELARLEQLRKSWRKPKAKAKDLKNT
jgi:hypothetical protein